MLVTALPCWWFTTVTSCIWFTGERLLLCTHSEICFLECYPTNPSSAPGERGPITLLWILTLSLWFCFKKQKSHCELLIFDWDCEPNKIEREEAFSSSSDQYNDNTMLLTPTLPMYLYVSRLARLSWTFFTQGILKQLLTEGVLIDYTRYIRNYIFIRVSFVKQSKCSKLTVLPRYITPVYPLYYHLH